MCIRDRANISEAGGDHPPSWKIKFPVEFPIIIRNCPICRTARRSRLSEKSSHIQFLRGIQVLPKRWNHTRGILPVPPVPNFIPEEVAIKKFYPKTVAVVRPGVSSRSEKRGHISHFLALPVLEKYFPGSSEILLSRDIPNFYRGRNFFIFPGQNLVINFGLAIHTNYTYYFPNSSSKI